MCLILIARDCHPRYRLVMAANRDEFHLRPTAAMQWWDDAPGMLAGRDLQSGGTWMAIGRNGRFGALANYFVPVSASSEGLQSRGDLIPGWIAGTATLAPHAHDIVGDGQRYQNFNCLLGDLDHLCLVSNCDSDRVRALGPGIHGLSNDLFERPFAKVSTCCQRLEAMLSEDREVASEKLLALLATSASSRKGTDDAADPNHAKKLHRVAPMIVNDLHGTRCTTIILVGRDRQVLAVERRFDRTGRVTGQDEFRFAIER